MILKVLDYLENNSNIIYMKKVIVFDMDKTLGYFTQLGVLIEAIEEIRKKYKRTDLYKIFDLYPECFRWDIQNIKIYKKK